MVRLGQLLYRQRIRRKLSLEDIERATKIKSSFIAAIERGEYNKLPSPAYAKGFVTNYASFLGLPRTEVVALFRREFDEKRAIKVLPDSMTREQRLLSGIRIQDSLLVIGGLIVLFIGFLLFQYRAAFIAPPLNVTSPKDGAVFSQNVTVSGKTDSDSTVIVNNEVTALDNNGAFTKQLAFFPGKAEIVIKARNRFGKETTVTREITIK